MSFQREIPSCVSHLPLSKQQYLESFKLRELAEDNFKFDGNDRRFSKWIENTDRKEEIAC